jgi:hypothetical protein
MPQQHKHRELLDMKTARYHLQAKSGGWTTHPHAHSPSYRLLTFTMTVKRNGRALGGNNIQLVLRHPSSGLMREKEICLLAAQATPVRERPALSGARESAAPGASSLAGSWHRIVHGSADRGPSTRRSARPRLLGGWIGSLLLVAVIAGGAAVLNGQTTGVAGRFTGAAASWAGAMFLLWLTPFLGWTPDVRRAVSRSLSAW